MISDLARDASRVLTGSLSWIVKWPCWSVVETWMQQFVVVAATFRWPVTDDSCQTNFAVWGFFGFLSRFSSIGEEHRRLHVPCSRRWLPGRFPMSVKDSSTVQESISFHKRQTEMRLHGDLAGL